jgi:hypothetical protein
VLRIQLTRLSALLAFALFAGCDTRVPTQPPFDAQVINLRNDLALQITGLQDATSELEYTWQNDGTAASVTQSPTLLTGTALLFVFDATGTQVYQRSLAENGTFTTTAGAPGSWTVKVRFSEANGDVTLRLANP